MFNTLINALESFWGALVGVVQTAWNYVQSGYVWLVGVVVVALGLIDSVVQQVYSMLQTASDALASIVMPSGSLASAPSSYLAMANTFFPLDAAIVMALALAALWAATMTYRVIKSWLPTVS